MHPSVPLTPLETLYYLDKPNLIQTLNTIYIYTHATIWTKGLRWPGTVLTTECTPAHKQVTTTLIFHPLVLRIKVLRQALYQEAICLALFFIFHFETISH